MRILVIFSSSWGEVDWILPVLRELKRSRHAKVTVCFKRRPLAEQHTDYVDLFSLLKAFTDDMIVPPKGLHSLDQLPSSSLAGALRFRMKGEAPDWVLHDYCGEDFRAYYASFPSAKIGVFPHSTMQYRFFANDKCFIKSIQEKLKYHTIPEHAKFFIGHPGDRDYFSKMCQVNDYVVVGYPKFADAWINTMRDWSSENIAHLRDYRLNQRKILLVVTPKRKTKGDVFERTVKSVASFALKHELYLDVRKHPRQGSGELEEILDQYPKLGYGFSRASVLTSSFDAEFVVTHPSCGCMDVIHAGRVPVEYFDYAGQDWSSFFAQGDRYGSLFFHEDIVLPVSSEDEFVRTGCCLLGNVGAREEAHQRLLKKVRSISENSDASIIRMAEVLVSSGKRCYSKAKPRGSVDSNYPSYSTLPPQATVCPATRGNVEGLVDILPPFDYTPRDTEADYYGASDCIAHALGLPRPLFSHATWTHGWISHELRYSVDFVSSERRDLPNLVYTKKIEEFLRVNGYTRASAVGAPYIYAEAGDTPKIPNSLCIFAPHTTEYSDLGKKDSIGQAVTNFLKYKEGFELVVVCLGAKDVLRGTWINELDEVGIPWITGAWINDRNALVRMKRIFESFEYVGTSVYGSQIAYACYSGCRVFYLDGIDFDEEVYRKEDVLSHPFYRDKRELGEFVWEQESPRVVKEKFPFLFQHYSACTQQIEWAKRELGESNRKSPEEIADLLGWKLKKSVSGWEPANMDDLLTNQEIIERTNEALNNKRPKEVIQLTNLIKRRHLKLRNVDLLRGLAFFQTNEIYAAREAIKEELRHFPDNEQARDWLKKLGGSVSMVACVVEEGVTEFDRFLATVRPFTRLSHARARSLYDLARRVCQEDIAGDFVECGVAAGGSTMLLALVVKVHSKRPRIVHAFDTFEGMPDPGEEDTAKGVPAEDTGWGTGTCAAPEDFIQRNCERIGVANLVVTHKGLFEETLPVFQQTTAPIAFLHMDGDWYSSTRAILDNLYDKLQPKALIQIDDYGAWDGCRKAIQEFERERGLSFDLSVIDDTGRWFRNPSGHSNLHDPQRHPFINPPLDPNFSDLYFVRRSILETLKQNRALLSGVFLDVGCGVMPYRQLLTSGPSQITRYIGLDIETETYRADVDLRWDGRTIPMEDASVDSAMATEVLEHCPEPLMVLKEIRRVLKPGGVFFFTVPYIWPLHDAPYDYWRYTPFSLKKLLGEAGFADADVRALSGWNASLAQMMGLWLKRAPMTQEKRNEMAQRLWPLYQELVTTDQLPDNPEAGNTMATGWSGIAYAPVDAAERGEEGDGSDADPEACDFPLLLVRSHAANYSETFIEDHVRYISRNCTVLYGWPLPRIVGDRSVLADDLERSLRQAIGAGGTLSAELMEAYARGLAAWIGKQGFAVALLESGLMGSCLHQACELAKLPFVIHFHGVDAFGKDLLAQWGDHYRKAFKTAHSVIGVSQAMVSQLVALGAPQDKVILGPYGVDVDPPRLAKPAATGSQFIAVGRFVDKKAPHKTLQAFEAVYRKVPAARLVMIGDGPLLKRCQQWVKEQGIEDAVTFMGVQSRTTVSRMLSLSRAFVQHSVTAENGDSEGLPLAVLEAGAHGLPVIATRHAGIPDAVVEGECGFLVDEHDVLGMAKAMLRVAKDGELAARMGTAFRQRVREHYSRKVSIERLQGILKSAAKCDASARPSVANQPAVLPLPEGPDELLQLLSRDRGHGPAYVKLATQAAQAGNYEEAYLYFKEAERVGGLPEGARGMLTALEAHPDLDTEAVRTYRGLIAPGAFGQAEQRRRILVFTNLLPPQEMGGYGRTVWEFCDGLIQRGHDVRILTADLPELAQEPYADYQRVEQHVERTLKLFGGWERGEIKEETDEKVIIAKALHNVRTIMAAVSRFKPDICMAGNLDLMSGAMLDPILKQGIPVLHRLGNAIPGYAVDATPQSELYCIAGCSQWINDNLVKEGYRPKHFAVLPAGAPLNEYYRLVPPSFDKLRICFAGLVMPYKGPQLLIGALGMLHKLGIDFTCEIAGEQKDADFIAHLLKYVRIGGFEEKVRWNGFLNRNQLAAMFSRNNTFVFPSVFEEPFGKVQIEAQAAGLAVVRSAVGGYKDMLEDEVNGLLFKPNDAEDLARQLYVLQGDKDLWAKIAAQGQVDAFRFTTSNCVTILDDLMGELLAKRP